MSSLWRGTARHEFFAVKQLTRLVVFNNDELRPLNPLIGSKATLAAVCLAAATDELVYRQHLWTQ